MDIKDIWDNSSIVTLRSRMLRFSGSEHTVLTYVKGVKYFLEFLGFEDSEVVLEKVRSGEIDLEGSLNSYIDGLLAQGLSRNTIQTNLKGLKKWLDLNGISFDWNRVERPRVWTVVEDRAPTKEELHRIMELGNLRDRFIISFLVSSGVRIGTLVKLKVGDVNLDYDPEIGRVEVPAEYSKLRRSYYTFITPEAKELLIRYLDERKALGEEVTPESPLIGDKKDKGQSVTTQTLRKRFHTLLIRAGLGDKSRGWFKLHLHTLRKYFRTQCEIAGMPRPLIETFMGHKGRYLDNSYWRSNEEQNKEEYRKAIPNLTIIKSKILSLNEVRKKQVLDTVKLLGFDEERIKKVEEVLAKYETVDDAMDEIRKLGTGSYRAEETMINGGINERFESKVVSLSDLTSHIDQGWEYLASLDRERFLVRRGR